jgi:putative FmdB family regulatory protein
MPIFSYRCSDCENQFDLLVGVTSDSGEQKCPKCGSTKINKILSGFSVRMAASKNSCSTGTCSPNPTGGCPTCF